jgi:hypothetical protein
MRYGYEVEIAQKYGLKEAIVVDALVWWIRKHRLGNEERYHVEGRWWCYASKRLLSEWLPHLTPNQIRRAIERLEKCGAIVSRQDLNDQPYDRTKWYALAADDLIALTDPPQRPIKETQTPDSPGENAQSNGCTRPTNTVGNNVSDTKKRASARCPPEFLGGFLTFWARYPRLRGKGTALRAYIQARRAGVSDEEILAGVQNLLAEIKRKGTKTEYIPYPATWLNREGWLEEPEIDDDGSTADLKRRLVS